MGAGDTTGEEAADGPLTAPRHLAPRPTAGRGRRLAVVAATGLLALAASTGLALSAGDDGRVDAGAAATGRRPTTTAALRARAEALPSSTTSTATTATTVATTGTPTTAAPAPPDAEAPGRDGDEPPPPTGTPAPAPAPAPPPPPTTPPPTASSGGWVIPEPVHGVDWGSDCVVSQDGMSATATGWVTWSDGVEERVSATYPPQPLRRLTTPRNAQFGFDMPGTYSGSVLIGLNCYPTIIVVPPL